MQLHTATYGATNSVVSRLPCQIYSLRGYARGSSGSDRWIQLHDASQLPANGVVPKVSMRLYDTAYYLWDWNKNLEFSNGCIVAISTTEGTLTISTDLADFFVDGTADLVVSGASVAGNMTTARQTLDISTAPCYLYSVRVRNAADNGVDLYAMLFNKQVSELVTHPTNGTVPQMTRNWRASDPDQLAYSNPLEYVMSFGTGLYLPKACVAAGLNGEHYDETGENDLYIEAIYKAA